MKKKIIVGIIIAAVIIGIAFISIYFANNNTKSLEAKEIANIEKVNIEMPEFTIVVTGLYDGTITNLDLNEKNIDVYDFDAGVFDGWRVNTNRYTGVKINDVLKAMNITDFSEIEFEAPGALHTTYLKTQLTDKTYLVFYRDGKQLREGERITLLSLDYEYRFSLENIITMVIK